MRHLTAAVKIIAFLLGTLLIAGLQMALLLFHKGRFSFILPYYFHKMTSAVFRIRCETSGERLKNRQVIFVSNHISYLDIPLMGGVIDGASFVAKKDVASWPLFGFLSKLQHTAFIDRSRSAAVRETNALSARIQKGDSLIIFPEGTSTDGRQVLPFKSSLFSVMLDTAPDNLQIQPVTLTIKSVDGKAPEPQNIRNLYAWPREMEASLAEHLWLFAKSAGAVIEMTYHPPIAVKNYNDRKTLAKACHDAVCNEGTLSNAA